MVVIQQHPAEIDVLLLGLEKKNLDPCFPSLLKRIYGGWNPHPFLQPLSNNSPIYIFVPGFFSVSSPESNLACTTSSSNRDFSPDMLLPCGPLATGRCHHLPSWAKHASVSYAFLTTKCHLFGRLLVWTVFPFIKAIVCI